MGSRTKAAHIKKARISQRFWCCSGAAGIQNRNNAIHIEIILLPRLLILTTGTATNCSDNAEQRHMLSSPSAVVGQVSHDLPGVPVYHRPGKYTARATHSTTKKLKGKKLKLPQPLSLTRRAAHLRRGSTQLGHRTNALGGQSPVTGVDELYAP